MKTTSPSLILILITIAFSNCGTHKAETDTAKPVTDSSISIPTAGRLTRDSLTADTVHLKESYRQEDFISNEYLADQLKPIRANFKRINSISRWTVVKKAELWESTEGGEATYYYTNGRLEKITARYYGETGQQLNEYYLIKGRLSFVFEKAYEYNRPIYYDSARMKENNDNEVFDMDKAIVVEVRNYFENGQMLHQLHNQDCGAPFSNDYLLEEGKRIQEDFNKLVKK